MSFLTGLLSAVAGPLLGGLFGSKQQSDQNEFNEENYERQRADAIEDQLAMLPRLRESAEKAGFNPLTALGATGASGFGQTGIGRAPKLASQSLIGNALTGAADFMQQQATEELTHRRVSERIKQINEDRALVGHPARNTVRRTNVAQIKTSGLPTFQTKSNRATEQSVPVSVTRTPAEVGDRISTSAWPTHISGAEIDTRFVDAEHWEQRYGDIAQEFGGGINLIADLFHSGRQAGKGMKLPTLKINLDGLMPKIGGKTKNKARTKNRPSPQKQPNYKRPAGSAARKAK